MVWWAMNSKVNYALQAKPWINLKVNIKNIRDCCFCFSSLSLWISECLNSFWHWVQVRGQNPSHLCSHSPGESFPTQSCCRLGKLLQCWLLMCFIPDTPSQYFLGAHFCLQFPGSCGYGKQQTSCLCCMPIIHRATFSYQGKVESLNKHIWLVWRVQGMRQWGLLDCAKHTNCHSKSWEPVMIDNTSYLKDVLYGFLTEGGWVAGCGLSHYSPPVIQHLQQMDPPVFVSWSEDKWWPVLSIFGRVSLGCQLAILCSWQQNKHSGDDIHRFSFPVVPQGRRNKVFAQLLLLL